MAPQRCENGAEAGLNEVDRRINFIVAGVQKAGTTALYDYLAEDPNIGLSRVKEPHFFDDESIDWAAPDYAPYHAQFDEEGPPIRGEATPIYLYWPRSLERIAAYNRRMKIIVLLRDPVERAWSHWKMEFARGAETEPFAWCIRQGRRRLLDSEPWGAHREFSYVERGFYGEQVQRLLDLFPRDQVLIAKVDDLRRDPNAVLAAVNAFLGAPPPAAVTARSVHVGREMDYRSHLTEQDAAFLRTLYARDLARLEALTGLSFP